MNCPKCGAAEIEHGTWPFSYECGSGGDRREKIYHSVVCVEICDLRKRVAFAEKWREVVLSKTEATLGGVYSMMTNTPDKFGTVAEMFDSAVRKEME